MSTALAVETADLTKIYDNNTAVNKLNLRIQEGEIFGFLGPNGAGKTTTILMLLGLTEPTSGVVRVCGYNSTREPLKVKLIAGYVPEKVGFYEDLTARYNLTYVSRLNGIAEKVARKRIDESLNRVGLSAAADERVGQFSRGMKQRLAIADILVKLPKVAILDEPTAGIDPEGVKQILYLISGIAKETGMTIIMSSHQLQQVQQICSRVGIMVKGRMVVEGQLDQLEKDAGGGGRFKIEIQLSEITSDLINCITRIDGVVDVTRSGDSLVISSLHDIRPQISKTIVENNGLLLQMKIQSYTLEDIYLRYISEV